MGKSFDDFLKNNTPYGSINSALTKTLYGINHNKGHDLTLLNNDKYGFVFFTRPQLNLTTTNIRRDPVLYNLLNKEADSVESYIKNILDPRLAYSLDNNVRTNLVNYKNVFIPVLTNTVKVVSGWPDVVLPVNTSKEGVRKEVQSMGDGIIDIYSTFNLNVTFKNIASEVLTNLFYTWERVIANQYEGIMSPYPDFLLEDEINYNTRIYVVVTSADGKYVKKIASTGASFPVNVPIGQFFDFDRSTPLSDSTKDISVRFQCDGVRYNQNITIDNFNSAVGIFNSNLRHGVSNNMIQVPESIRNSLAEHCYPNIDLDTTELKWYAEKKHVEPLLSNEKLTKGIKV